MKILLMGNPNVGKSVIFSRLTGIHVIASNYPGTTVSYTRGFMRLGEEKVEIIDVPGTYTLEPSSQAEQIALQMLETVDVVINVIDATKLERNLYLTLQLLEKNIPVIIALNMWDDTKHHGISIDVDRLKNTVNENWNLFNNDNGKKISDDDVLFIDERTDDYIKLVEEELAQNQGNVKVSIAFDEDEEINVDDI